MELMAFNHYAKLKRILENYPGWRVVRIDEPTTAQSFKGEVRKFDYYYRLYTADGQQIKYGKFQQIERFAQTMGIPVDALVVTTDVNGSLPSSEK